MAAKKRFVLEEGQELRGYMLALYPTDEQARTLRAMQAELMAAWNVLVISRETHIDHCVRWAEDNGVELPAVPERPADDAPDDVWAEYRRACGARRLAAITAALEQPGLGWADWRIDYKRLRDLFGGKSKETRSIAPAQAYTALVERFRRTKGPNLKRYPERMPLQIKSGKLWTAESELRHVDGVGTRTNGELSFAGMRIRARWWREPAGEFLEGASIRLDGFKWVASLKVKAPERRLPAPDLPPVAVNTGLKYLAVTSDGKRWLNPRGNEYTIEVARLSAAISTATDPNEARDLRNRLKRYQGRAARRTKNLILTEILPALARHSTVFLAEAERGLKTAAQGPQARLSVNDIGGYTSAMGELHSQIRMRLGARVREVECYGISQTCSHCGHTDKYAFRRGHLREYDGDFCRCPNPRCPSDGVPQHVDENAARNVLAKGLESLESGE